MQLNYSPPIWEGVYADHYFLRYILLLCIAINGVITMRSIITVIGLLITALLGGYVPVALTIDNAYPGNWTNGQQLLSVCISIVVLILVLASLNKPKE